MITAHHRCRRDHPELEKQQSSAAPESLRVLRVLQALRANRTPGWQFPGYYLGLCFDDVATDHGQVSMPTGDHLVDAQGRVGTAAWSVLADVALSASLRQRAGADARMATVSMRLSFSQLSATDRLVANSALSMALPTQLPLAVSRVSIRSGPTTCCTGEATFAMLENSRETAKHPLPRTNRVEDLAPLDPRELSEPEHEVLDHARRAAGVESDHSFLERFWQMIPKIGDGWAECAVSRGLHVGNRVGDVQGGVLLGLAAQTAAAVLGHDWQLVDISAQFAAPASGPWVTARAKATRVGRNIASIECIVRDDAGKNLLLAIATLARRGAR